MTTARGWSGLRLTSVVAPVARAVVPSLPGPVAAPPVAATDRARAAGHAEPVVVALARSLETLGEAQRRAVLDPLGRLPDGARADGAPVRPLTVAGVPARQVDGTTCGSAVLALLAAAGDPVLALWLRTGTTAGATDPRAARAGDDDPAAAAARWERLQRLVKRRTARRSLGPFPWPAGLGTPPWGAARTARYADVRYTHRVVGGAHGRVVLDAAVRAAARGVPVPLFTGGDLSGGLAAAVPRHVVLLTAVDAHGRCRVYEPSSGTVHRLDAGRLGAGATDPAVRRALGGWPHVVWTLLPARPAAGPTTGPTTGPADWRRGGCGVRMGTHPPPSRGVAMSTVPGDDAQRDAGLVEPDEEVVNLVEEVESGDPPVDHPEHAPDEYRPASARPDLAGEASEADVVEQASAVPGEEDDYA